MYSSSLFMGLIGAIIQHAFQANNIGNVNSGTF
jgi:hypothetical protein